MAHVDDRLALRRGSGRTSRSTSPGSAWSPTASTSSRSRMSKSTWIAIEYASRTCIPDEKFLSFWSTNRSSSAKATISSKRSRSWRRREAEQRAVDADVVARGQLGVEADAELDERRQEAVDAHRARVLTVDAGEDLQQRALAASVRPDDPEELALVDRERHVVEARAAARTSRRRNGWRKCSFNVVSCWCGSMKAFVTPSTSIAVWRCRRSHALCQPGLFALEERVAQEQRAERDRDRDQPAEAAERRRGCDAVRREVGVEERARGCPASPA